MSDTWRTSRRQRDRLDKQTEKEVIQKRGGGGIKGNRCTRKAFSLRIFPERELIIFFLHDRPLHWMSAQRCRDHVRDQPWVRVRGPAGPRTVTKMSTRSLVAWSPAGLL